MAPAGAALDRAALDALRSVSLNLQRVHPQWTPYTLTLYCTQSLYKNTKQTP
jgi:hypothetical protein